MENIKKSLRKREWEVMEFYNIKRVQTQLLSRVTEF